MEQNKGNALNEPVLVLNGNFEPLNVCNTRRALSLVIAGKAAVVENGRGEVHSAGGIYPRPSVVRLVYVVRRPRPKVRLCKHEVFRRDDFRCVYCGKHSAQLTLDHVNPRNQGGGHSWLNLVTACPDCNRRKGGRTPEEAGMSLLRQPFEPHQDLQYLFAQYLLRNEEWRRYIQGW